MSLFQKATERKSDSLVVSVWGVPKAGKTTFYLGNEDKGLSPWPTPIYVFNFDQSVDELLERTSPDVREELYIIDLVSSDPFLTDQEAINLNNLFEKAVREALVDIMAGSDGTGPGTGTIVLDTASQYWQLVQTVDLAQVKRVRSDQDKKLMPFDYARANTRY